MRTRDPESPSVFPDGQTTKNLTKRSNWVIRSSFLLSSFEKCLPSFSRQTITFPEQEQFKPFPRVRLVLEMFSGCRNTWFGDHYGRMFDIRGAQHVPITEMKTFRNGSMCMYKLPIIFSTLEVLSPWGREWILMSLQMLFATNWNLCSLSYQLVEIPVICSHPWKNSWDTISSTEQLQLFSQSWDSGSVVFTDIATKYNMNYQTIALIFYK